ncbi:hypothetical protein QBC43DRAFT_358195 [Cladorrhinum sp. PSN259]|nr:hypothetical protein QBC43DRAFT_358195 [Cladorrhinum sp. PSN259]
MYLPPTFPQLQRRDNVTQALPIQPRDENDNGLSSAQTATIIVFSVLIGLGAIITTCWCCCCRGSPKPVKEKPRKVKLIRRVNRGGPSTAPTSTSASRTASPSPGTSPGFPPPGFMSHLPPMSRPAMLHYPPHPPHPHPGVPVPLPVPVMRMAPAAPVPVRYGDLPEYHGMVNNNNYNNYNNNNNNGIVPPPVPPAPEPPMWNPGNWNPAAGNEGIDPRSSRYSVPVVVPGREGIHTQYGPGMTGYEGRGSYERRQSRSRGSSTTRSLPPTRGGDGGDIMGNGALRRPPPVVYYADHRFPPAQAGLYEDPTPSPRSGILDLGLQPHYQETSSEGDQSSDGGSSRPELVVEVGVRINGLKQIQQ